MHSSFISAFIIESLWCNHVKHFLPSQIDKHPSSLPITNSPLQYAVVWIFYCVFVRFSNYLSPLLAVSSMIRTSPSLVPTTNFHQPASIITAWWCLWSRILIFSISFSVPLSHVTTIPSHPTLAIAFSPNALMSVTQSPCVSNSWIESSPENE